MTHEEKVERISKQLAARVGTAPVSMKKKVVSHTVPKPNVVRKDDKIDVSDLNDILEIDAENKICIAEPGVTFTDLVKATMKHGLVPMLVPELKTITIGGAVSGCSVESTSYKFGGFHDTCLEYEIITAKGEALVCTPDNEHSLIYEMAHGSFGTLGILTKLKFRLMDAKPYVRMNYVTYGALKEYKAAIQSHYEKRDVDFMDGIIHSKRKFVLCIGTFVDSAPYTSDYTWMNVFYKSTRRKKTDYMTTHDYFFRYDADAHWLAGKYGLEIPLLRFLLGKQLLSSNNLLETAGKIRSVMQFVKPDVVVDVFVPMNTLERFFELYFKKINYFPIWIVPFRIAKMYPWMNEKFFGGNDELYIDVAIYGMKQGSRNIYKVLDGMLMETKGTKTLISHNFYDEETFWRIWNRENYSKVKERVDPDNIFRDLYAKMHPNK